MCAAVNGRGRPDFTIDWGDPAAIPDEPPAGVVLARMSFGAGGGFVHTRTRTGFTLRFPGICEFRVDRGRRAITAHLAPGASPEMASLLLGGNVAGFLLTIAGECLLHASAVERDGAAIAFVGVSGSGKSTLAAIFCTEGSRLVSDDVIRLKIDRDGCRCFAGTLELRMRLRAAQIARSFPDRTQRRTVDHRIAIRPNARDAMTDLLPLRAIVIPRLARESKAPCVRRLSRPEALFGLSSCPAVIGWQVQRPMRRQFQSLGRASGRVPVYEATIPWGRPHSPALREVLLARLNQEV